MDELLSDLKVLGKREISTVMKWRSRILQKEHVEKQKADSTKVKKVELTSRHHDEDEDMEIEIQELSDHED
jgi:hypothetical protein